MMIMVLVRIKHSLIHKYILAAIKQHLLDEYVYLDFLNNVCVCHLPARKDLKRVRRVDMVQFNFIIDYTYCKSISGYDVK